ncbi:MAG: acyltransferase [Lachnospiraceae bacterium]|nr:acyltransferase [Lachnospiraceae bacterium]
MINKKEEYEYMRVFAILAVLLIHFTYMGILQYSDTASAVQLIIYNGIKNLMLWAVPCFLMLSGTLLLDQNKEINFKKLYNKYIKRMFLVLLTFGLAFSWLELYFESRTVISLNQFVTAIINVLTGNTWAHMWYVYCLIGLYLLLPMWRIIAIKSTDTEIVYILLVMAVCEAVLRLPNIVNVNLGFYNHISSIYPFWFLMGTIWNRKLINIARKTSIMVIFISSLLLLFVTYIGTKYSIDIGILTGYNSILVIPQAIAIYSVVVREKAFEKIGGLFIKKLMIELADKSFGMYLLHMFFINFIYKVMKIDLFKLNWGEVGLIYFSIVVLSYTASMILRKCPLIGKIV